MNDILTLEVPYVPDSPDSTAQSLYDLYVGKFPRVIDSSFIAAVTKALK